MDMSSLGIAASRARCRTGLIAALLCAVVLAGAGQSFAVEPNIYIAPSIWQSKLSGDGSTSPGGASSRFDWDDPLGIDTKESVSTFEGFIRIGNSRFLLGIENDGYAGKDTLDSTLVFGDRTFPQGGELSSDLNYRRRRVLYGRPIAEDPRLSIGILAGIESYKVDTILKMTLPSGTRSRKVLIDSKVPMLGASLTFYPIPNLRIYGQATGMSLDRGGVDSKLFSAYGVVEYTIIGDFLAISLGYRYSVLEARDEDLEAKFNVKQQGTFTGLVFRL
jgi:hypothetical protein